MNTKQQGFTLIELVVVIVILGILAAVAVPKFVSLQGDARKAVVQGIGGSILSASSLAHAQFLARNSANGTATTVEGVAVTPVNGYPNAASITNLISLQPITNFTVTAGTGTVTITPIGVAAANVTTCQIVYTEAATGAAPTVGIAATNCD